MKARKPVKTKILKTVVLLALWCCLFAPVTTLGYGWGVERGRANEGDVARLLVDQLVRMRAQRRIDEAIGRPLAVERQRVLLGISDGKAPTADELTDGVYDWWLKDVMGPAEAIAGNPAASCAEAQVAVQSLLIMMGQRQLFGLETEFQEMFDSSRTKLATRCREEALDECVMTGRFEQILQTELGLSRGGALLGGDSRIDYKWMDDALKQCAIYELHFVSTTKVTQIFNVETVRDGKIILKFEDGVASALIGGEKLGDLLKGETKGAENPFLVSVKCLKPPLEVTCSPGAASDPVKSRVIDMDLKHREFYVDSDGRSKERIVGEDKFSFEFARGIYDLEAIIIIPTSTGKITVPVPMPIPMKGLGFAFYIAHKKDRFPQGYRDTPAVKVERNKRGVYPVIFEFTYADQDTDGASASDSTVFELIHKPKPDKLPARAPEPTRKPLKPSTRIKRIGG